MVSIQFVPDIFMFEKTPAQVNGTDGEARLYPWGQEDNATLRPTMTTGNVFRGPEPVGKYLGWICFVQKHFLRTEDPATLNK